MNIRHSQSFVLVVLGAVLASVAHAEAGDPLTDRFSASLGGFLLGTDTTIRVDGEPGQGSEIDLENDFGFDDTDRFRIDGYWRMTPRQKIRVMYFDTKRSETRPIQRDIVFQGETYPVNTEIELTFSTTVAELAYEFAFLRGDSYELNGTIGIHNLKFGLDLDVVGQSASGSRSADANGPMPMLGVNGIWKINDKFYVQALAQWLSIDYDVYEGRLSDVNASFVWQAFEHWGFGVGYNTFTTRLDVDGDNFHGSMKWRYGGARLFVIASF
jgi:hypothetical protein